MSNNASSIVIYFIFFYRTHLVVLQTVYLQTDYAFFLLDDQDIINREHVL